jgi:hypothetical protein
MNELSRQDVLNSLTKEHNTLMDFLSRLSDEEWRVLVRNDGWSMHDIAAHVADVYLSTVRLSGVAPHVPKSAAGMTLPMMPDGRVNIERLNMLRYQTNRELPRDVVVGRLHEAHEALVNTIDALEQDRLDGPGPYGPPYTMLTWFNAMVLHVREHRLQMKRIYTASA